MLPHAFWSAPKETIFAELNTGLNGISAAEAQIRVLERQRQKKVQGHVHRDFALFFSQFKSPLVLLLVAAIVLSAFLGEESDVIIISCILVATGLKGFFQERNAGKAVE